jgi:hypothetical protein
MRGARVSTFLHDYGVPETGTLRAVSYLILVKRTLISSSDCSM